VLVHLDVGRAPEIDLSSRDCSLLVSREGEKQRNR
jgi:hypothetical protein